MVENTKKLAWGARGRRFKSSHPGSFIGGGLVVDDVMQVTRNVKMRWSYKVLIML